MSLKKNYLLLFLLSLLIETNLYAQPVNDFQTWSNFGFSKAVDKKTDVALKYILGMEDNSRTFMRSMFSLQVDHKITKWLKLGIEYRYATQYNIDFNRFWFYANVKKEISKKWDIAWRPLYQKDIVHFNQEYENANPDWPVLRNMVTLKYKYNKKWEFYFYVDPYVKFYYHQPILYRFRYGPGFDYYYKKRLDLGLEMVIIDEFNVPNPWSYSFANIKCVYDLPKWKKIRKHLHF